LRRHHSALLHYTTLFLSHCGGIWKENFPLLRVIYDTGRALPASATKAPTSTSIPDNLTSSHEGTSLPSLSTVRSQRPINPLASSGTTCVAALCISSSCFCMEAPLLHEIMTVVSRQIIGAYIAYFFISDNYWIISRFQIMHGMPCGSLPLAFGIPVAKCDTAVKLLTFEGHDREPTLTNHRHVLEVRVCFDGLERNGGFQGLHGCDIHNHPALTPGGGS